MDRTQAFAEYGRILEDLEDSVSGGFRRQHAELEVSPPSVRPSETASGTPGDAAQRPDAGGSGAGTALSPAPRTPAADIDPSGGRQTADVGLSPPLRPSVPVPAAEPPSSVRPADPEAAAELRKIAGEVGECRQCNLYLLREHTVPGIGSPGAMLMVVTPPPSDTASELTSPLPAYEQEYLEKWLRALGLDPAADAFVTPAVKCRTPGSRPPQPEEAAACTTYLRRQYKAVAPRAVLALGSSGCGTLTGDPGDFPSLVGKDWTWGAVPALVLWTPAEVLANPGRLRAPVWDALQRLKAAWNAVPGSQL